MTSARTKKAKKGKMAREPYNPLRHSVVQVLKGDAWRAYEVPNYVEALFFSLCKEISRVHGNVYQGRWTHWDADPEIPGVQWQSYVWDCECPEDEDGWGGKSAHVVGCPILRPNCQIGEVQFSWYKYPGRGMSTSWTASPAEWVAWFDRALGIIEDFDVKLAGCAGVTAAMHKEDHQRCEALRQARAARQGQRSK